MLGMKTEATCKMKTKTFTAQWKLCYMAGVGGQQQTKKMDKTKSNKQASKQTLHNKRKMAG